MRALTFVSKVLVTFTQTMLNDRLYSYNLNSYNFEIGNLH